MCRIVCILACSACSAALLVPLVCSGQAQQQSAPARAKTATPSLPPQPAPAIKTDPKTAVKPAPPTPIAEKKAELGDTDPWKPEWDKLIEQSLPPELLSNKRERAVKSLCPRFKFMNDGDKRAFWAYFFQALAGAEAGLRPTANVRHTEPEVAVVDTVTHRIVRQEGLLQLTYMDGPRYGCAFDWDTDRKLPEHDPAKTILQPKNNLLCGLRILDNQLLVRHKPLLSKSSYWVTLRPHTFSFDLFIKQMANEPAACGRVRVRVRSRSERPPATSEASDAFSRPKPAVDGTTAAAAH